MVKKDTRFAPEPRPGVGPWGKSAAGYIGGSVALEQADRAAREVEAYWGAGRLWRLLEPDLAEKLLRQQAKFNRAIWHGELHEVEAEAGRMATAWRVCHRRALEAGHEPLSPEVWEVALPDGRVLALCRDGDSAQAYDPEGRRVTLWTLQEVAEMVAAEYWVNAVKREFPGAEVTPIRPPTNPLDVLRGDDIDF
jgi:hypothetical protein